MIKTYEKITELYEAHGLDSSWVKKNAIVIQMSQVHGLAIAGSLAMGIMCPNQIKKEPGDLDFVCDTIDQANSFIAKLNIFLSSKQVFYQIRCNNNNKFTAPGATIHFRYFCPFWKEICVMVIPKVNYFYWNGLKIQLYGDVKSSMKEIEEKSPKGRIILMEDDEPAVDNPRDKADTPETTTTTAIKRNSYEQDEPIF